MLIGTKPDMSRAGSLRPEHGFSPTGSLSFVLFFLLGVLFYFQFKLHL